jgi:hypothetical protein
MSAELLPGPGSKPADIMVPWTEDMTLKARERGWLVSDAVRHPNKETVDTMVRLIEYTRPGVGGYVLHMAREGAGPWLIAKRAKTLVLEADMAELRLNVIEAAVAELKAALAEASKER